MVLPKNEEIVCESKSPKPYIIVLIISGVVFAVGIYLTIFTILNFNKGPVLLEPIFAAIFFFLGVLTLYVFFSSIKLQKNIQLIITDKRIYIYSKNDYIKLSFDEVLTWKVKFPIKFYSRGRDSSAEDIYDVSKFIFETQHGVFKAKGITNYDEIIVVLKKIMSQKFRENLS